jgi:hypothetical protein
MPLLGLWSRDLLGNDAHFLLELILAFSQAFSYYLLWVSLHVWPGMWSGKQKYVRDKQDQWANLSFNAGISGFTNNTDRMGTVVQVYNPSYSGGRDPEDHHSSKKSTDSISTNGWAQLEDPYPSQPGLYLKNNQCKKSWRYGSSLANSRLWVQSPVLSKKKKKRNPNGGMGLWHSGWESA